MKLSQSVLDFFAAHSCISSGGTLLVAVSGGADSLCLLHVLVGLRESLGIDLHVAHLDHMLRAAESTADAAFVQATAEAWGVPATVEQIDVAAYAAAKRLNLHDAARQVRYAFLARCALAVGAASVAVGHHANDQAETVLLHLLRGAGTTGLAAMRPVSSLAHSSATLIRPLLATSHAEIAAYCAAHGLAPRHDASNDDQTYSRNRIRHELLPALLSYNPRIVEALGRTANASADDSDFIGQELAKLWPRLATERATGITLDGAVWRELHPALQRAALRQAYATLGGTATLGWQHTEQVRALADGTVGRQLPLPGGLLAQIGYGGSITVGTVANEGPQITGTQLLEIPSVVALAGNWHLCADTASPAQPLDRWTVALDHAALMPPLVLRGRQPGDRMRPAGGRGSRLIQDIFVDAKMPRDLRAHWPIIADRRQIVWIAGLRAAEGCTATTATPATVWIQVGTNLRTVDTRS